MLRRHPSVCMPAPHSSGHSPKPFEGHLENLIAAATKSLYLTTKKFFTELRVRKEKVEEQGDCSGKSELNSACSLSLSCVEKIRQPWR